MNKINVRSDYNVLRTPFIRIEAFVASYENAEKSGVSRQRQYIVAPTAKKIATYIRNQIFGSEIVTQTEGLKVSWLMPTLKEALEEAVYQQESFVWIHKYNNKVYLQCLKKNEIHNVEQEFDIVKSGDIIQDFEGQLDEDYVLIRHFEIEDGKTIFTYKAMAKAKSGTKEPQPISIQAFNKYTGNEFDEIQVYNYEAIINIDIGQDFFADSEKLLLKEMEIINTMFDEIDKTKTKIVTSQHYQTGDIFTQWQPKTNYNVEQLSVGKLADYFTLLPGDKEHQVFEFLQGQIRVEEYERAFKFCDYQIIQSSGLSTASFGYEKDAYMNEANVDLSKNNSEMTIESIKTQIEEQINKLIENIVKCQQSIGTTKNVIPSDMIWDYGANEQLTDMKKLQVMKKINNVASVPYSVRAKIILPILNKMIDAEDIDINKFVEMHKEENDNMKINFGEL